jgi:hypothetical protein
VKGHLNHIEGEDNRVNGLVNDVSGEKNKVNGVLNHVEGANNRVEGSGNIVGNLSKEDEQKLMGDILSKVFQRFGAHRLL